VEKAQARKTIQQRIERLSTEDKRQASERVRERLADLPEFQQARSVLLFVSIADEVDTLPIIRDALAAGKHVAVPKVDVQAKAMDARRLRDLDQDIAPGVFGILEPQSSEVVPPRQIDFILVPARGFDREGNRLGRGGGYYDRYMSQPGFDAWRCGVAFACQVLDAVPHDETDLPVHLLVTDEDVLRFTGA
jgi:5-formyltetrahydrofolate cyclo-ligase